MGGISAVPGLRAGLFVLLSGLFSASAPAASESPALPDLQLPALELIDQNGRAVRLEQLLSQQPQVAIQFIFTRCGLVCPLLGFQFGQLRKALGERLGTQVALISISVDPLHDTPAELRAWAARFNHGPGWTLLTGDKPKIDATLKALAAFSPEITEHSSLILIGTPQRGAWRRLDASAPAAEILSALEQL